jgi:hypothetical protein
VRSAADDRPLTRRAAPWCEHEPARGGDLPRPRRAGRDEHEAVALEQHERLRDEVRAPLPRRGTRRGDLPGADGLTSARVLRVSEGAEDDALLGGHDPSNLPRASVRATAACRDPGPPSGAVSIGEHGGVGQAESSDTVPGPVRIGVPKETASGERRVALVPEVVRKPSGGGHAVVVQAGAGEARQGLRARRRHHAVRPRRLKQLRGQRAERQSEGDA